MFDDNSMSRLNVADMMNDDDVPQQDDQLPRFLDNLAGPAEIQIGADGSLGKKREVNHEQQVDRQLMQDFASNYALSRCNRQNRKLTRQDCEAEGAIRNSQQSDEQIDTGRAKNDDDCGEDLDDELQGEELDQPNKQQSIQSYANQ